MELTEFSTGDLLNELESRGSHVFFTSDRRGSLDALEYVMYEVGHQKILAEIDADVGYDVIVDYLENYCDKIVTDRYNKKISLQDNHIANVGFRRNDAIEILEFIVNRDGWDKVFAILEPYRLM